jgi:hypothetical protein
MTCKTGKVTPALQENKTADTLFLERRGEETTDHEGWRIACFYVKAYND